MSSESYVSVPMAIALDEVQRASANHKRFWNLLYAVAAATAATLIFGLIFVILGQFVAGIASGVVTLIGGAGTTFLVHMKDAAAKELEAAKDALRRDWAAGTGERGAGASTTSNLGEGVRRVIDLI